MAEQLKVRKSTLGSVNKKACFGAGALLLTLVYLTSSAGVLVSAGPVRVKNGDWIRYDSINIGEIPFATDINWSKVEFLNVSSPTATIRVTMKRNNETESVRTTKINIASDSKAASGFSGFMIPTDLNVGDTFRVSGWGNVTITGETTRTYAGGSRTVVYAPYSETKVEDDPTIDTKSYWDKETGIFLEETVSTDKYTMSFTATKTNMWSASAFGIFDWQFLVIIIIPVAAVIVITVFVMHMRKKPVTSQSQNESQPSSDQSPIQE